MNCAADEFENKIMAKHPNKWFSSNNNSTNPTIYALDDVMSCYQPEIVKEQLASHVWKDGFVIKDATGLFSITISAPNPPPHSPPVVSYNYVCTEAEFTNKIKSIHPKKDFYSYFDSGGKICICVSDDARQHTLNDLDRERLASHVWKDGLVTKDVDGIFAPVTLSGANYQYHSSPQYPTYAPTYDYVEKAEPEKAKCECGAHKVGSNSHSSWCALKEIS
jgi:hypothetical protein